MKALMLIATTVAAGPFAASVPAFSHDAGVKSDQVDKSSGPEDVAQRCERPWSVAGDKEKSIKMIYVGPRQNIPNQAAD